MSEISEATWAKARKFRAEDRGGKIMPDKEHPDIWWVQGGDPDRMYRVQFSGDYVTCTCHHGLNHGGEAVCYHRAAVELVIDSL